MLNLRAWMLFPLMTLPLDAQEPAAVPSPILPEMRNPPPVDLMKPVPPPNVSFSVTPSLDPNSMPKNLQIVYSGATGNTKTGAHLTGPVKMRGDNGLEMFSDEATVDFTKKTILLVGNVSIYQGNSLRRGDRAIYHYDTKFLETDELRTGIDSIFMEAGKFTSEQQGKRKIYHGTDAGITTADEEHPNFWLRGKDVKVYGGDKVVFKNMLVYAGDTPVFWLPYMSQPLDSKLGYHFVPGVKSNWGPYLLNSYGIMLGGKEDEETGETKDAWLMSLWRFDILTERGVGNGLDLVDTRVPNVTEFSGLSLYYLNDLAPQTTRSGISRDEVNEDRYRIRLKHRLPLEFEKDAHWRLDTNLTVLSDQHYLEDFDPDTYRVDPFPDNTVGLFRRTDETLLTFMTRLDWNDFYRADRRLPEVAFDQARLPILDSPIQHEGTTSFSIIQERAADTTAGTIDALSSLPSSDSRVPGLISQLSGYERQLAEEMVSLPVTDPRRDQLRSNLLDIGYARFHTYQEFSMPMMLGKFFSLTPDVGVGYNRYDAVSGPLGADDQAFFHAGVEAAVKFTKDYGQIVNHDLGLNGLLHVFQPYANWSILKTGEMDEDFPGVDRLTATTRPQTLDPSIFTAIDEMNNWNVIRLGTRNRLLTKRDGQAFDWLFIDTYMDLYVQDPEGHRKVSNLYNDMRWSPVPWMNVGLSTQFPIASSGSGFTEVRPYVQFMPTQNSEVRLGYRYLEGHPILLDSNLIDLKAAYRFNDWWSLSTHHVLEAEDGVLQSEDYMVHRDLGNWVAGVGFTHRDNRVRQEYGVVFSLVLKDFPSVALPFEFSGE